MKRILILLALIPILATAQNTDKIQGKVMKYDTIYLRKPVTDTSTQILVLDQNGRIRVNSSAGATPDTTHWNIAEKEWVSEYFATKADTIASDTTGIDPLCKGLSIYSLADSTTWQHAWRIDSITGDTTGCEWIDVTTAKWAANGNTLYYGAGPVMANHSLYASMIYPKPGTAAINLRATGLDPGTEDLAAIQIWGSAGGYINSYAKREWSGDLFQALQRLDPFSTYQTFTKNGLTISKIRTDTNAVYPEVGKVNLGTATYPWNDGYSKNFHFNDTIFLKGRLGPGYIKLWNDRYARLACDATSFYFPNIPAASKPMVLNYDTETGLIGYSLPDGFTFTNRVTDSTSVLLWIGDSMLRGGNCSQPPTPDSVNVPKLNGCTIQEFNPSTGGYEICRADSLYQDYIFDHYHPRGVNIMVVWLGVNDLRLGHTAGEAFKCLEAFCVKYKALGYRVIVATLPSYSFAEAKREEFNRLIRLNWTRWADGLADLGFEPHIGPNGAYANTSYFCDGLHLTVLGNDYAASVLQAAVDELILGQRNKYFSNIDADTVRATVPGYQPLIPSGNNGDSYRYISGEWRAWPDSTGGGTSQWTTVGSNIYYNGGNTGIGTSIPIAKHQITTSVAGDAFAITSTLRNKNQTTQAQMRDTSAMYIYFWPSGKMEWTMKNSVGAVRLWMDTLGRFKVYDTLVAPLIKGTAITASTITASTITASLTTSTQLKTNLIQAVSGSILSITDTAVIKYERIDAGTSKVFRSYGTGGLLVQNAASAPSIGGERSNGTATVPTAVVTNDILFAVNGRGYDGSGPVNRAAMRYYAGENWTTSANGTYAAWLLTANGGETLAEKMRLTGDGRLGIGETTPLAPLHIKSAGATSATAAFRIDNSAGTNIATYLDDGKVGIGTSAPGYSLTTTGDIQMSSGGTIYGNTTSQKLILKSSEAIQLAYNATNYWSIGNGSSRMFSSSDFGASVNGAYRFYIPISGNVGIGTTTPTNKLHVPGYVRFGSKVWVGDSTGTYSYINPGDAAWTTSSSRTIKENIIPVEVPDSLFNRVLAIGPKKYNFKLSNFLHNIPITAVCDSVQDETYTTGQTYRKLTSAEIQRDWKLLQHNDSVQAMAQAGKQYVGFIAEEMAELTHGSDKEINYMEVLAVIWQTQQALIRKAQEQEARLQAIEKLLNIQK